jgi:hypothetical protein
MILQWKGPFQVVEVMNKFDYRIKIADKLKTFHINFLKKYDKRQDKVAASVAIIEDVDNNSDGAVDDESLLNFPYYTSGETDQDISISEGLSPEQRKQVLSILEEFSEVF